MTKNGLLAPESCKVYTPLPLAEAMVAALGTGPTEKWLEPCFGKGAFLRALAAAGVPPARIFAIDLEVCSVPEDHLARAIRGMDFLSWSRSTGEKFDRIIGNPPYTSLKAVGADLKASALAVPPIADSQLSPKWNYWAAFLQASLSVLSAGGAMCFVLPASWDYADYAHALKEQIYRSFSHVEVHRCKRPMFEGVQEGCIVLLAKDYGNVGGSPVRYEHYTSQALIESLAKANREPATDPTASGKLEHCEDGEVGLLSNVMDIHLGGVTGDSQYFLLTESERIALKLPKDCLRPTLSRACHLRWGQITFDRWLSLREANQRIWLFRPPPARTRHPAVAAYLELDGLGRGCNKQAYKVKNRDPWHKTPLPKGIDAFVSGMSRTGPWLCLRSMPELTATNTLYVATFRSQLSADQKAAWGLSLLTSKARSSLRGRVYADGLVKLEPGDLGKARLPRPRWTGGALAYYSRVIETLLCKGSADATRMCDEWFNARR
jgi:hypothetical protein